MKQLNEVFWKEAKAGGHQQVIAAPIFWGSPANSTRSEPVRFLTKLWRAVDNHAVLLPYLVFLEVMRGKPNEREAAKTLARFQSFLKIEICSMDLAEKAARHFRFLRSKGLTVRGTIDLLIATWCIENNLPLLHSSRDYAGFETHLGLKSWHSAT